MAGTFSKTKAAAILAECEFFDDDEIAKRWGITPRTIRNYRSRLPEDKELAHLFQDKKRELSERWLDHATGALLVALQTLQERIPGAKTKEDCELIYSLSGCVKILGDLTVTAQALLTDNPPTTK